MNGYHFCIKIGGFRKDCLAIHQLSAKIEAFTEDLKEI
jgi:hypothetical protein